MGGFDSCRVSPEHSRSEHAGAAFLAGTARPDATKVAAIGMAGLLIFGLMLAPQPAHAQFGLALAQEAAQPRPQSKQKQEKRVVQSGTGCVGVDPKQPYRPIPLNRVEPRESIFSFYLRVMNPRQVHWGDELKRRLDTLSEQSVENPYFRLCAFQLALISMLLTVCWLWWDKLLALDAAQHVPVPRHGERPARRQAHHLENLLGGRA